MKVPAKGLLDALKTIRAACKVSKTYYDILQCVHMSATGGVLSLVATNLDQQVQITLPCDGDLSALAVNSDDLSRWLAKAKNDDAATLEVDGATLVVRVGRSSAKLPLPSLDGWPSLSEPELSVSCLVSGGALIKALGAASVAVFKDPSRPHLCGVSVETGSVRDERTRDRLALCGTNGTMLMAMDIAATGLSSPSRIILPPECVDGIQRLFRDDEAITLSWGERLVEVKTGAKRFVSKLVDGVFPDRWRQAAGADRAAHLSYDRKELEAALATVSALSHEVQFSIAAQATSLSVNVAHSSAGANDECPHSVLADLPRNKITINAEQITDLVGALDAETVQLSLGNPVVVTGAALDDRVAYTVPMYEAQAQAKAA